MSMTPSHFGSVDAPLTPSIHLVPRKNLEYKQLQKFINTKRPFVSLVLPAILCQVTAVSPPPYPIHTHLIHPTPFTHIPRRRISAKPSQTNPPNSNTSTVTISFTLPISYRFNLASSWWTRYRQQGHGYQIQTDATIHQIFLAFSELCGSTRCGVVSHLVGTNSQGTRTIGEFR